jgi:hypothetical protein
MAEAVDEIVRPGGADQRLQGVERRADEGAQGPCLGREPFPACQTASKRDPGSARKRDPLRPRNRLVPVANRRARARRAITCCPVRALVGNGRNNTRGCLSRSQSMNLHRWLAAIFVHIGAPRLRPGGNWAGQAWYAPRRTRTRMCTIGVVGGGGGM